MMDKETLEALRGMRESAYQTYLARLAVSPKYRELVLASMATPGLEPQLAEVVARYRGFDARVVAEEKEVAEVLADSKRREAEGAALAAASEEERT
jgi:hypothetical protein